MQLSRLLGVALLSFLLDRGDLSHRFAFFVFAAMLFPTARHLSFWTITSFFTLAVPASGADPEGEAHLLVLEGRSLPEFRSMVTVGNQTSFSLRDSENGVSFWISEGEVLHGIEIVGFMAEKNALTIYLADEIHQLPLSPSSIAELSQTSPTRPSGERLGREERRARYREFLATWQEATENSTTLGQLDQEMRALAAEFRETRDARRQADRGTDLRQNLREIEQEIGREIRLVSEYTALQAARTSAFQQQNASETELISRMLRGAAFRRSP